MTKKQTHELVKATLHKAVDEFEKKQLDRITDVVLAYRPKPKTKAQKKRARKAKRAKGA